MLCSAHCQVLLLGLISWNIWKQISSSHCHMKFLVSNKRQKEVAACKASFFSLNSDVFGKKKIKLIHHFDWWTPRKAEVILSGSAQWGRTPLLCYSGLQGFKFEVQFWEQTTLFVFDCVQFPALQQSLQLLPGWIFLLLSQNELWAHLDIKARPLLWCFKLFRRLRPSVVCIFLFLGSLYSKNIKRSYKVTHRGCMETLGREGTDFTW